MFPRSGSAHVKASSTVVSAVAVQVISLDDAERLSTLVYFQQPK